MFLAGLAIALGGVVVLLSGDFTNRRKPAFAHRPHAAGEPRRADSSSAMGIAALLAAGGLASWLRRRR
jgi:hypothetical protein